MTPTPFKIFVPDAVLSDLHRRLIDTRGPDAAPNSGWEYGSDLGYIKELVEYWAGDYDGRASEALLNQFQQ
ncbi:MAG: epoxide hydrolase N-terminal domain-containing protein [Chloroflexota bacterium]